MAQQFRTTFTIVNKNVLHWFPGHMAKGLKQMQDKLKGVDCIIEVHDARIPLSGRNPNFKFTISGVRPHILVLNKRDLAGKDLERDTRSRLLQDGNEHVLFTSCKDQKCRGIKQIVPLATKLICASDRYNRSEEKELSIMVIGVPNVGKSSVINTLRNLRLRKASVAAVGAKPGITRAVQTRIKVNEDPPVYLLDTPGIVAPSIANVEAGLRLALCATLQDHLVGEEVIADYLLYSLNKRKNFRYVDEMNLEEPVDDIRIVLATIAVKKNKMKRVRDSSNQYLQVPDLRAASYHFIRAFREGKLEGRQGKSLMSTPHLRHPFSSQESTIHLQFPSTVTVGDQSSRMNDDET
ncbi:hypothetical protein R5R35_003765 [Gryllus longicercus]|uniref:CP-type G domain-containing protein n=1 Tax=Gryllus longicercus TaxID=2509291 RepID=A0AAN9YYP4_9ORTH